MQPFKLRKKAKNRTPTSERHWSCMFSSQEHYTISSIISQINVDISTFNGLVIGLNLKT